MERQANFIPPSTSALTLKMSNEASCNLMPCLMLLFDKHYNYHFILMELCISMVKSASHGPQYLYGIPFWPWILWHLAKKWTDKSVLWSLKPYRLFYRAKKTDFLLGNRLCSLFHHHTMGKPQGTRHCTS